MCFIAIIHNLGGGGVTLFHFRAVHWLDGQTVVISIDHKKLVIDSCIPNFACRMCLLGAIMDPQGEPGCDCPLQSTPGWYVWQKEQGWRALPRPHQRGKRHHQAHHLWRKAQRQCCGQQGNRNRKESRVKGHCVGVTDTRPVEPSPSHLLLIYTPHPPMSLPYPGHRRRIRRGRVPKRRANISGHSEYPRHEGILEET